MSTNEKQVSNALGSIMGDPRNIQNICANVAAAMADILASDDFEQICIRMFRALGAQGDMNLLENYDAVCDIVMSQETKPSLKLSEDRFGQLIRQFAPQGNGSVDIQGFTEFMRFAVAVVYLEQVV